MVTDLFSESGISAWQARLNHSPSFAEAAGSWAGRLLLPADEVAADYVLSASPDAWIDLITARHTPATSALLGHLTLLKGSIMSLIPHAKAAAELLAAAAEDSP